MMADGSTRTCGEMSTMIAHNSPGITNFVTPVKTACRNHTPLLLVTPQVAHKTIGQGGFEEVEQMKLFEDMVACQAGVRDPTRVVEVPNQLILEGKRACGPARINLHRDFWTQVVDIDLPTVLECERPSGGEVAIGKAARLLSDATFPVILHGAGVVLADGIDASFALGERLAAPVCVGYKHNDAFPGTPPFFAGPLGYNGSKAGMEIISKADVVLALGTRLKPFLTLPGYGIGDWPKHAQIIQVDINPDHIGLTKKVSLGVVGDAEKVAEGIFASLSDSTGDIDRGARKAMIARTKFNWAQQLSSMDHVEDDPGTILNERACAEKPDFMSLRMAWRAIQSALPREAIISSDIGNNCIIGNACPSVEEGRGYLAPRPLRPVRLWPARHRRHQDRLPGLAGCGVRRRRRVDLNGRRRRAVVDRCGRGMTPGYFSAMLGKRETHVHRTRSLQNTGSACAPSGLRIMTRRSGRQ